MDNEFKIGPFTAMELDQAAETLQAEGISFELTKDAGVEDRKIKDDINAIVRTEFRTDVFLDQSYFIVVDSRDESRVRQLLAKILGAHGEVIDGSPDELKESAEERLQNKVWQGQVRKAKVEKNTLLMWVVLTLVIVYLGLLFYQNF